MEGLTSERYKTVAGVKKMDMDKLIASIKDLYDYKNSVKGDLIIYSGKCLASTPAGLHIIAVPLWAPPQSMRVNSVRGFFVNLDYIS